MSPRYYPFIFLRYICKKETSWSNSFEIIYFSRSFSRKFYQRNHEWSNLFSYNRVSNLCKTWSRSEIWSLGGKLHKIPSREGTTYHVPLERKKKKERRRFRKAQKIRSARRRPPSPRPSQFSLFNREAASWSRLFFLVTRLARGWEGRVEYAPRGKTWKLAAFSSHPRELFRAVHRSNATGAASWLGGEYETGNDGGFGPSRARPSGWKFILFDAETSFGGIFFFILKIRHWSLLIFLREKVLGIFRSSDDLLMIFALRFFCTIIFHWLNYSFIVESSNNLFNNNSTIRVYIFYNSWNGRL